jgi:hypothetical protein
MGGPMATPGHLWGWPRPPQRLGVAHWLGPATLPFFVFFFLKKKVSLFIYFLINLYFFIQMDTCCHLIGLTWHLTESVKFLNRI